MQTIESQRLTAMLKIMGVVRFSSRWTWRYAEAIRDAKDKGILTLVHTKSHCRYGPDSILHDPHNWDQPRVHSTYQGCHDFELVDPSHDNAVWTPPGCKEDQQYVVYTIWNGYNLTGEREDERVTYYLTGDWTKIELLAEIVASRFKVECRVRHDRILEARYAQEAEALGESLIDGILNAIPK